MATRGGKRNGAGRPAGTLTRPRIDVADYFSDKELKDFWNDLKTRAKTDTKIALYFAEQMSGKAAQAITGPGGGPIELLQVTGMKVIPDGNRIQNKKS